MCICTLYKYRNVASIHPLCHCACVNDAFFQPDCCISTDTLHFQQDFTVTRATSCCWCILLALHACHYLHEAGLCNQQGKATRNVTSPFSSNVKDIKCFFFRPVAHICDIHVVLKPLRQGTTLILGTL